MASNPPFIHLSVAQLAANALHLNSDALHLTLQASFDPLHFVSRFRDRPSGFLAFSSSAPALLSASYSSAIITVTAHISILRCRATVNTSLSPLPHMFMTRI